MVTRLLHREMYIFIFCNFACDLMMCVELGLCGDIKKFNKKSK